MEHPGIFDTGKLNSIAGAPHPHCSFHLINHILCSTSVYPILTHLGDVKQIKTKKKTSHGTKTEVLIYLLRWRIPVTQ